MKAAERELEKKSEKIGITDIVAATVFASLMVPMALMYAGPTYMNADTPFLTIMSLQKESIFIWGQNRFLNIVPFLAGFVKNPVQNLAMQLFLFGGSFVLLFGLIGLVVSRVIVRSNNRIDSWLFFSAFSFVFFVISSRYSIHVFISEGQPYGLSCLLMGVGLALVISKPTIATVRFFLAQGAILLGAGLNPSLAILVVVLCVIGLTFWPTMRRPVILACVPAVGACAFWLLLGRLFPGPSSYGSFSYHDLLSSLDKSAHAQALGYSSFGGLVMAAVSLLASIVLLWRKKENFKQYLVILAISIAVMSAWFVFFSQNHWISLNGWHFRYFYPCVILLVVILALPPAWLLYEANATIKMITTFCLLLACPVVIFAPWKPIEAFPIFAHTQTYVDEAHRRDIRFIAGSYWTVWPTVFLLSKDETAFGIEEERAPSNREHVVEALNELIRIGRHPQALCVDASVERCLSQAPMVTGRQWRATEETCGANCSIIETATMD